MQSEDRTRYSDAELEEFRELIESKLDEARTQMNFYMTQLQDMADGSDSKVSGLDDGLTSMASEETHNLAARQQKLIRHLENALIRVENKVYGICRETGKLIPKQRLMVVPHATLSIQAKQGR